MSLHDIQERVRKKKRKRRRRMFLLLLAVSCLALGIFITRAQYFAVGGIVFEGNSNISSAFLEKESQSLLGQNIFLFESDAMLENVTKHPYFAGIKIKRKLPDRLIFSLSEKNAEVSYYKDGVLSLLTRDGTLLEVGANKVEGVMLADDMALPGLGENIYAEFPEKAKILEQFRYLHERNISEVVFETIDLSDLANIRTFYGDLEIRLGYSDSMKEKLNAAINIILAGDLRHVKGYVDISSLKEPVVFDEAKVPLSGEEPDGEDNE